MREGEDEDRANKERERSMCKLTLFGVHPKLRTTVSNAFHVHKDMTLDEATEMGWKVTVGGGGWKGQEEYVPRGLEGTGWMLKESPCAVNVCR